jgi:microcystin-dependent protein
MDETPFLGEIRSFGFGYPPVGWMLCDGSVLAISQNTALFAILGTLYGGDGARTFALPDLRGRNAIGMGTGPGLSARVIGQTGGAVQHTLLEAEAPAHVHTLQATAAATTGTPGPGTLPADTGTAGAAYKAPGTVVAMAPGLLSAAGGGQPHENRQPALGLNYAICTNGIFPTRV